MTRRADALLAALAFALLAAPAVAQAPPPTLTPGAAPAGQPPPREARRAPHVQLFISPSGEPFRTADGLGAWLTQADADHDGAVTAAEFRADAQRYFKVLDANGDGVIDGFEVQAYEHEIVPEIQHIGIDEGPLAGRAPGGRGGRSGRGGMGHGGGGMRNAGRHSGAAASPDAASASQLAGSPQPAGREGASRFSLINQPEPVLAADTNIDGKVTLDEWMKATSHRFELLDKAKTGKLTRASLTAPDPDRK